MTRRRGARPRQTTRHATPHEVTNEISTDEEMLRAGMAHYAAPIRLISHSSSTPEFSRHAPAHRLAQRLDIGGGGAAEIDQEIAVHLRDLRGPVFQATAAGGVDELPCLVTRRILEGRAAGAALDRLRRLARFGDFFHLRRDRGRIAGRALEQRLREDDVVRRAAMAIGVVHVGVGEDVQASLPVDGARLDQCVLGLAAIGAAVHAQRPADRAGDAAEESEPGDRRLLGGTADLHVGDGGAGADAGAVLDLHLAEAAAEPDDDARHPAVAHDQVGAEPDDRDWNLGRQLAQRHRPGRPRPRA